MKINKDLILKNISAILCAVCIIALVLPFCKVSVEASVMGVSAESGESVNGITMVTDSGAWGYLFVAALAGILLLNYVKQLVSFKKIGTLVCSGVMILSLFMSPGNMSAAGGEEGLAELEISVSYGIGFWIILICSICLAGISVISFFGLKGNPVFDAVNSIDNSDTQSAGRANIPNVDFSAAAEKLGNVTKNITGAVSQQAGTIIGKTKDSAANKQANSAQVNETAHSVETATVSSAKTPADADKTEIQQTSSIIAERENNDYIMENINKLFEMKEKGILTDEEFTAKKSEYLSKL